MLKPILLFRTLLCRSISTRPRESSSLVAAFCVLILISVAVSAIAQTTSSVSGTVRDSSGALIPDAKIVLVNDASKATRSLSSNGEGYFYFAAVQPATYSIEVNHDGFDRWKVTGIIVHPGDNLTIPKISMKIGTVDESVVVTAEVAGVQLSSGEHSTLITADNIKHLSTVGRDVAELVTILPGFTLNGASQIQNQAGDYQTVGFGSGNLSTLAANGAAPQQGLVSVTADGANVIDPGDMGGQISNVNMDQVQEVKVQTSNFGADEAKGPIVINAVGKAGGADFHGSLYSYFRNYAANSNDWLSKYYETSRPKRKYFFPGGNVGGPVKIPGTSFNRAKKLVFWAGFEYYGQQDLNALATAFVPNADMLGGDLSTATIAKALNVDASALATNCPYDYSVSATYTNLGGLCWSPTGTTDQLGNSVSGGSIPAADIDPAVATFTNLYPKINRTPQPVIVNGATEEASDGINYVQNVMATHNGFQLHSRVDQNFSETLKLYGTYNWEKINDESPLNNIYYNPTGTVPYPTALYSNGSAHYLTLNLTKTVGATLTNELTGSGVYFNQPEQFSNRAAAQATGTPWETAGYSGGLISSLLGTSAKSGVTQLPRIIGYESVGTPSFAMGYVPSGSQFLRKYSWNIADNLTKVYRTHSIKVGIYAERTANNQVTLGSQANGTLSFMRWDTCYINQPNTAANLNGSAPSTFSIGNMVGALLTGCPLNYAQDTSDPNINLRFTSLEGYATDEWKVNSKLTLTFGMRFSHLGPWTDAHGVGIAVWKPSELTQHVLLNSVSATNTSWSGFDWHAKNSSTPVAGVPTRPLFYSPRFGLSYDMFGDGRTVLRGGWGAYHSHDAYGAAAAGAGTAIGLRTWTIPGSVSCTFGQLFTTSVVPCTNFYQSSSGPVTPFAVNAVDGNDDRVPLTYNYNLTVDQALRWKTVFELAYVGNQSSDLLTLGNLQNQNVIPLNAFFGQDPVTGQVNSPASIPNAADYRPYPNYQQINVPNHIAWSNYNALQASLNKQAGSLIFGLNYTWSKALGVRGNYDTGYIADPVNPHHDYGILGFDRRHAFNASYSWNEGVLYRGNKIVGQVLNGWEISGITKLQSGPDLAVLNNSTNFGLNGGANYTVGTTTIGIPLTAAEWLGSSDYGLQPTVTCDPRLGLKKNQFVNGNCFGLPDQGSQGVWNLPDVPGPVYFSSDLTLIKDFKLTDRQNIQFRLAGFNFLNHPITSFNSSNLNALYLVAGDATDVTYSTPQEALSGMKITNASTFGSTNFKVGQRILEASFKYSF